MKHLVMAQGEEQGKLPTHLDQRCIAVSHLLLAASIKCCLVSHLRFRRFDGCVPAVDLALHCPSSALQSGCKEAMSNQQ